MPNVIDFFELDLFRYRLRLALGIRRRVRRVPLALSLFARLMDAL